MRRLIVAISLAALLLVGGTAALVLQPETAYAQAQQPAAPWDRVIQLLEQISSKLDRLLAQPAAPAPAAPAAAPAAKPATVAPDGSVSLFALLDGRSYDPRTTAALPELGFPAYQDTGVLGPAKNFDMSVPDGYTALVFGVTVQDHGSKITRDKGSITAYKGPVEVHVTVKDGAYKVVSNAQAASEYCARVYQHLAQSWLMSDLVPLAEWGANHCGLNQAQLDQLSKASRAGKS